MTGEGERGLPARVETATATLDRRPRRNCPLKNGDRRRGIVGTGRLFASHVANRAVTLHIHGAGKVVSEAFWRTADQSRAGGQS